MQAEQTYPTTLGLEKITRSARAMSLHSTCRAPFLFRLDPRLHDDHASVLLNNSPIEKVKATRNPYLGVLAYRFRPS